MRRATCGPLVSASAQPRDVQRETKCVLFCAYRCTVVLAKLCTAGTRIAANVRVSFVDDDSKRSRRQRPSGVAYEGTLPERIEEAGGRQVEVGRRVLARGPVVRPVALRASAGAHVRAGEQLPVRASSSCTRTRLRRCAGGPVDSVRGNGDPPSAQRVACRRGKFGELVDVMA
jgi:hypothetical protein